MITCESCNNKHAGIYGSGRFCSSKCAKGFSTKNKRDEINKKVSKKLSGLIPWNKNKFEGRRNIKCVTCGCEFMQKTTTQQFCSKKCIDWEKIVYSKQRGGYRPTAGRGRHGWYKGIWCDSSYELAFVIYNKDHSIDVRRCKDKFPYVFKNKNYTYNPDFLVNDEIIEIKGFMGAKEIAKKKEKMGQIDTKEPNTMLCFFMFTIK